VDDVVEDSLPSFSSISSVYLGGKKRRGRSKEHRKKKNKKNY